MIKVTSIDFFSNVGLNAVNSDDCFKAIYSIDIRMRILNLL